MYSITTLTNSLLWFYLQRGMDAIKHEFHKTSYFVINEDASLHLKSDTPCYKYYYTVSLSVTVILQMKKSERSIWAIPTCVISCLEAPSFFRFFRSFSIFCMLAVRGSLMSFSTYQGKYTMYNVYHNTIRWLGRHVYITITSIKLTSTWHVCYKLNNSVKQTSTLHILHRCSILNTQDYYMSHNKITHIILL